MIIVYCDGEMYKMTLKELKSKGWNVLVTKSNGYSHIWSEIFPFDKKYIKNVGGFKTIWCTTKQCGFEKGSSEVSFS